MADIHVAATGYPGVIDTATTLTNDTVAGDGTGSAINANHQNYPAGAIIAIETELGTNPSANAADLKTRLAVSMDDDGKLKLGTAAAIAANLLASKGGTGIDTSGSTGVPTISSGTWSVAAQLSNVRGGTGQDSSASTGIARVSAGTWSFSALGQSDLDTALGTCVRGDVIVGDSSANWTRLAKGAAGTVLSSDGTDVTFGVTLATQSDMETATSTTAYVTPGRTQYHPGVAKAWANWNNAGTLSGSYNVTSITDNGTGDFVVNFTTSFASTGYSVAGGGGNSTNKPFMTCQDTVGSASWAVGSFRARFWTHDGTTLDADNHTFMAFGDQ